MQISKTFCFEAAHLLPRHQGKCSRLHGHSYKLRVEVGGPVDKESGFILDYGELKKLVQPIVDRFDHRFLNSFIRYSSAENIAIHVAHELRPSLIGYEYFVVTVSETENTTGTWDSRNAYDEEIFDKELLDSAPNAMDAEWRSPDAGRHDDIPKSIGLLETATKYLLQELCKYDAQLEQLRMYMASLKPVDIRKELGLDDEPEEKENEKA